MGHVPRRDSFSANFLSNEYRGHFPGVMRPKTVANNLSLSCVEIKNTGDVP